MIITATNMIVNGLIGMPASNVGQPTRLKFKLTEKPTYYTV